MTLFYDVSYMACSGQIGVAPPVPSRMSFIVVEWATVRQKRAAWGMSEEGHPEIAFLMSEAHTVGHLQGVARVSPFSLSGQ